MSIMRVSVPFISAPPRTCAIRESPMAISRLGTWTCASEIGCQWGSKLSWHIKRRSWRRYDDSTEKEPQPLLLGMFGVGLLLLCTAANHRGPKGAVPGTDRFDGPLY